ncbi:MAG: hypothetical protein M1835_001071 [Candelina submexicana]|nr:MAG: hypothetical protein M1835_001071 [Candelina submexicana]
MVATYSPHRAAGGTLHLPSPTHVSQIDASSAIRDLRRSLSRSPSKGPKFRLVTSKSQSPSPSPSSPLSPSPLSPPARAASASLLSTAPATSPSPLAVPYPPSAKINRPSLRRTTPMRTSSRSRTYPSSPAKRALSDSTDNGNATPPSSGESGTGEENRLDRSASPVEKHKHGREYKGASMVSSQFATPPTIEFPTIDKRSGGSLGGISSTSSPLKRSDGIMNLDQASLGSPVAKRRSLHGASFGSDFDIFEHGPHTFSQSKEQSETDQEMDSTDCPSVASTSGLSPFLFAMPKRSSSLRKSTLQQRHNEKPAFARSRPNVEIAMELTTPGHGVSKGRHRMSLENILPPMPRDSPFSSQGTLPSASVHVLIQHHHGSQNAGTQAQHHPHPLSRTLTQSSSSSSMADDSPTQAHAEKPDAPRPGPDFTKSMPVGGPRSYLRKPILGETSEFTSSSENSFATPENYKLVKPLPAAFMSTGLISKRNRNVDESSLRPGGVKAQMPDTPCKRPTSILSASTTQETGSAIGKPCQVQHEFGTPSTPFNPHVKKPVPGAFGKGVSIFGGGFAKPGITRRSSFVSIDGDDSAQSPTGRGDSQSSTESDFPPTPTKQILWGSPQQTIPRSVELEQLEKPNLAQSSGHRFARNPPVLHQTQNCKFPSPGIPLESVDGEASMEGPYSASLKFRFSDSSTPPASFARSRLLKSSPRGSPTPLSNRSLTTTTFLTSQGYEITKTALLSPASPVSGQDPLKYASPTTPLETMLPPDPSGLSISAQENRKNAQPFNLHSSSSSASNFPPATPTAPREYFLQPRGRRSSITPISSFMNTDVDASLTSRFDKVELVGTGEFSQVYRVTQVPKISAAESYFSFPASSKTSPQTPGPDRVWAVKKSKQIYAGAKDRQRKLQEASVLKSLGQSDHLVHMIDSWEENGHLYIQTEFCEEGSLDLFLSQVGLKARLDDFRTWKILLELSQGVKHIHDAGFIHLDLKPANVLITFEGVLKIADFGLATPWPASAGIEGEGDREYIGPEILKGQFDKPGDIFALGLIMLEIAANVELPENGASWQKLRTGDLSDIPSLTWSSDSNIFRDPSGNPISRNATNEGLCASDPGDNDFGSSGLLQRPRNEVWKANEHPSIKLSRRGELLRPPAFMLDPQDTEALDKIVKWMLSPSPTDRPVVDQILSTTGVQWVENRRRAGATVFEGNWGPDDDVLEDDAEMIDV